MSGSHAAFSNLKRNLTQPSLLSRQCVARYSGVYYLGPDVIEAHRVVVSWNKVVTQVPQSKRNPWMLSFRLAEISPQDRPDVLSASRSEDSSGQVRRHGHLLMRVVAGLATAIVMLQTMGPRLPALGT